jgi:hypothetical protein
LLSSPNFKYYNRLSKKCQANGKLGAPGKAGIEGLQPPIPRNPGKSAFTAGKGNRIGGVFKFPAGGGRHPYISIISIPNSCFQKILRGCLKFYARSAKPPRTTGTKK